MPWEIKKKGNKYCVVKKGDGKVVKCHPTRQKAIKHQKALYVNVHSERAELIMSEILAEVAVDKAKGDISLVKIPNVPIATTGIEYPLASGPTTFTEEDLKDAVEAASDPHILAPRLKVGHTDAGAWIEAGGEPSFGKVTNLRLEDNGQTIYGDYEGVPGWLAEILPTAYPSRSFEGNWNVETVGGKKYRLVINAVALLGVRMPGITSLEDLQGKYGDAMPEGVTISAESDVTAAVNVEDVRRQYYEYLDAEGEPQQKYWWIRGMQLNPNELIVDSEDGKLYRVPFKVKGEKTSFSEAVEVKMVYEDVAAEKAIPLFIAGLVESAEHNRREISVFASRQESGREVNATQEGGTDLDLKDVAKKLGLPEDATEEQVNARLEQVGQGYQPNPGSGQAGTGTAPMEPSPSDAPGSAPGPQPESHPQDPPGNLGGPATPPPIPPEDNTEPPEPVVAEDGTVRMDKATYDMLMQGARDARSIKAESDKRHREAIVAQAIKDGKIVPASRVHYLRSFEADPAGTEMLLTATVAAGGLAPGLVPVGEAGHGGGGEGTAPVDEGLPEEWFPTLRKRRAIAAEAEAGRTRVFREAVDAREAM